MIHVYVSGGGGVQHGGWFEHKAKIVENFRLYYFEGDFRTDENLVGTLGAACWPID